jgi:hypothetical protein
MNQTNIISSTVASGFVRDDSSRGHGWPEVQPRVERMLEQVDQKVTVFLGAAASSFKPTGFPAWDKFVEFIYTSQIDEAASGLGDARDGLC